MAGHANRPLTILNLLLSITETSGAYHQHCVAMAGSRDLSICTYFATDAAVPRAIDLFAGDHTLLGFLRALRAALAKREYDIVHAHSPHVGFVFALAALLLWRSYLPRSVYNVQNSYQNYKLRNKLLMLPIFACFGRVVCCSEACRQSFPRLYTWLAGKRLRVVANGLDIGRVDRAMARHVRPAPAAGLTVVSVGRLIEIKNPLAVLGAFQRAAAPDDRLIYIGDGHLRAALAEAISARGLAEQVELTGLIERDAVFARLSQADVVISASYGEGLPVAVIEAMACGCPVILSDIPPHREIAGKADFIPLVPPDDIDGFARAIARFQQLPPAARAHVGAQCRALVQARYSLATMHAQYEAIFSELIVLPRAWEGAH